jgi:hypothetical protein
MHKRTQRRGSGSYWGGTISSKDLTNENALLDPLWNDFVGRLYE